MTAPPLGRDFRLLWSAAIASRFGDTLRIPALALLAATLTRDPRVIAAVTVAAQLPPLLFGLLGGVYADRWDRRRTMAVADGLRAVVVGALAVAVATGRAGVATLLVAAFLLATLGTLSDAVAFALLPALVPPDALPRANGRLQAGAAVAGGFLGAPAAGVLFTVAAPLPFALDALTFVAAALLTLALRPAPATRPSGNGPAGSPARATPSTRTPSTRATPPASPAGARPDRSAPRPPSRRGRGRSVWREAAEGVRWLRADRTMWRITTLTAATNLAISALMAVLVLYALDVLRVPPAGYGLFTAAAVLGGVAGALGAGRLAARLGTAPALRVVLAAQTVALAAFALTRHPVPAGLALAVFAAGTTVWNSLWAAYGQRHVPADLLGRVGAARRVIGLLSAPLGAALGGLAGAAYGTAPVAAAVAVVFALVTLAAWRALRPAAPPPPGVPPTTAGTAARPAPHPSR
ncbi:MFS transporter [Micromonospora sp. H33]|uniref:MFS transporter n=1 Tax=Micromonospora sp. H33 TaxID=3452215 RepID=UPI003F8C0474